RGAPAPGAAGSSRPRRVALPDGQAQPGQSSAATRSRRPAASGIVRSSAQGFRPADAAAATFLSRVGYALLVAHDLFRKPVSTFRDHALAIAARGTDARPRL